ncbi:hypothetical protein O0I10_007751 [Lichtheimia ornata]|uniref:EF-hand domain-containing protein n=1 Tax=Lichtheimia ornata TaxID=688661 RepID=A0AAD7V209_9FUNG|nr:uncharacterized protein O0I10_007751 [Lichtheimia ornata]KAJ8656672.1 hypothetical protein O0I10_007751 [Lichtheimia ornata]
MSSTTITNTAPSPSELHLAHDLCITPEELISLKHAFHMLDIKNQGIIPMDTFITVLNYLNMQHADRVAQTITATFDIIDFEAFATTMVHLMLDDVDDNHHLLHHHPDNDLLACFKAFDQNGDNLISRDELQHVMTSLGERLSPYDITAMMTEADTNGDGFIDFEEFKRLLPE